MECASAILTEPWPASLGRMRFAAASRRDGRTRPAMTQDRESDQFCDVRNRDHVGRDHPHRLLLAVAGRNLALRAFALADDSVVLDRLRADACRFLAGGRRGGGDLGGFLGLLVGLLVGGLAGLDCALGRDSSSAFSAVTIRSPLRCWSMLSALRSTTAQLSSDFLQAQLSSKLLRNLKAFASDV